MIMLMQLAADCSTEKADAEIKGTAQQAKEDGASTRTPHPVTLSLKSRRARQRKSASSRKKVSNCK